MAGTADTLRTTESVPETLKRRAVAEHKEKRRKLNKTRRDVMKKAGMSPEKACKIMRHGEVHGKPLTKRQRGAIGARCGDRGD